jgi:hypothetical protein
VHRLLAPPYRIALASDAAALLAFVTLGLLHHRGGLSATGYARDALPLAGSWAVAARALDLYRRPRLRALAGTWLAGIVAGVLVRAAVVGHLDATFLAVALAFTLLLVVAFRAAAATVGRIA